MSQKKSASPVNTRSPNKSQTDRDALSALIPNGEVAGGGDRVVNRASKRVQMPQDDFETADKIVQDEIVSVSDAPAAEPSQVWTLAQANTSAANSSAANTSATAVDCKLPEKKNSEECDDDKGLWWNHGTGSLIKIGLAGAGILMALNGKDKAAPTASLETAMAAGPFEAKNMTLAFFGNRGLLLELTGNDQGELLPSVGSAYKGKIQVQYSKVMDAGVEKTVVSGVIVDFGEYKGAVMGVLFDRLPDDGNPVQFYDEVAGLIALESTALRAVTTINPGQNYMAITPFTEMAFRKAAVGDVALTPEAVSALLSDQGKLTKIADANKAVSAWVGVPDIVGVLPVAVNDVGFSTEKDKQAKTYGEKLAALSRLVPGNLEEGIERLLDARPADVPGALNEALDDFNDDNLPGAVLTPPSVQIERSPWVNAQETQPLRIQGTSTDADEGSVVRISVLKDGVVLASLKAEVGPNGAWQVPLPKTLSEMGIQDGQSFTIRAHIDPDHPDSVTAQYDATAPAAPQSAPDLLAMHDTGSNNDDDVTGQARPGFTIGALPEAGMTVEVLVNGDVVPATYDLFAGTVRLQNNLTDGSHSVTYRYVDEAGNRGDASLPLQLFVDTSAPQATLLSPLLSQDTGASATDWITNIADQSIRGQLSQTLEAGETLRASLNGGITWTDITSSVSGTSVNWNQVPLISDIITRVQFQVVDQAGNKGPLVEKTCFIDTQAPLAPSQAADLQAASDSQLNTDNVTNNTRPVFDVEGIPADAVAVEMWVNGRLVASTFNPNTQTLQPNAALSDGVLQVSYRFVDAAGNRSDLSTALSVTIDTRAPVGSAITGVTVGSFSGTYEAGSAVQLSIAGQPATGQVVLNSNGTWRYEPSTDELNTLRTEGAVSELRITVTDVAGNIAQANRTVTADDLRGPYVKEFIPADNGFLANDATGHATLNLVFSKPITKGTGSLKVFDLNNNLIHTVLVSSADVSIDGEGQNDVFVRLPGLNMATQYYVTLDAGSFVDSNQEAYLGQTLTGLNGWNFSAVTASIAPDFVTADDMINRVESGAVVPVTGRVVSNGGVLAAITTNDLTLDVRDAINNPVSATITGYNTSTGEFTFNIAANVWQEGRYRYTVTLNGAQGAAQGVQAQYVFTNLTIDLTAPTMSASLQSASDDAGVVQGDLWAAGANTGVSDDITPFVSGTLSAALSGDARVVVYRRDVTNPNQPGPEVETTGIEGLKPTGTTWSMSDSGLQDGRAYEYVAFVEDAAGNRSAATTGRTIIVDTSPPTTLVSALSLSQDSGQSATDRITNVASQTVNGTLSAPLAAGETLRASLDGGATWADISVVVNGTSLAWPGVTLPQGPGQVLFRVQDAAGNQGPISTWSFTLDQTPPAAPTSPLDLLAASDSGSSNSDNITNNTQPRLVVGALPVGMAGAQLLVDGVMVEAAYDANDGTLRPVQALEHGERNFSFRWVDTAGNIGAAGPALAVQIDTIAPSLRVTNIDISADSGSSNSDFITRTPAQTITGQLNNALTTGDKVFGSVNGGTSWTDVTSMINSGGQLSWTGVTLLEGNSSVQFRVVDVAGNISPISSQDYSLDLTPPETMVRNIDISADTGISDSDFITKEATQTVTGRLMDGDEPQALQAGDRLWASSNGGANWQDITSGVSGDEFTWTNVNLTNGASNLQFKVIDAAGNEGGISRQNYTLDMVAPAAPQNFAWATYPNGINTSTNVVSGTIGDVPFTYTLKKLDQAALNLTSTSNMYNQGLFPVSFGVPNTTSIRNDVASINQLAFDSPMSNPVLAFSSIGNPNNPVTISFPVPVEILWSTDVTVDQGTTAAATRLTGREGFMVVRLNGTVDDMRFDYLSNETYVNFAFGAAVFDLLSPEQDSGIKSIDDITNITRPAFMLQNKPADAVSAELLMNGQLVSATFSLEDNTLTPNAPISDGVYQVAYRYVDLAGNVSAPGPVTQVTIDSRAPVNTDLTAFTPAAISGSYEPGTTLSLKINGVSIATNRIVLNAANGTWSLVPTQAELTTANTGWLNKANSTFDLTATDLAGNVTVASKTVSKDVFNSPYVKEFIPADGGFLANDSTGKATLNLVFSKAVQAGTGKIKLFNVSGDALVAEIDVASNAVRIENGTDVYVTLPTLTTGTRYYVTLDAGTFVDSAGQGYLGKSETGTSGWDFTGALASIAPDFVAQDDIVNASESAAVVRITGKVVSSTAMIEDIVAGNLAVTVAVPQGAAAITATLQSYNNQTGEFVFTVPAQAWANGSYGYTVRLRGTAGDAANVNADYNFTNLAVDLVAPTGILGSIDAITDDVGLAQGNLLSTSLKLLESGYASKTGTNKVTDVNVTDLDLSQLSATFGGVFISADGTRPGVYNSGSTVYNANRSQVSFWIQAEYDGRYTKAVKLQLTDSSNGIELKIVDAKYSNDYVNLPTTHNWNIGGNPIAIATHAGANGYGISSLQLVSNSSSANVLTDDNTPTLTGSLTRALAQDESIAIDRTNGQGQTVTITGKAGLIVDGTTWTVNDGTLADGQYTYRVYVEDAAGNRTAGSSARIITVDTQAPTVTVTAASLSQDTGVSTTDRLTKEAAQTVRGTLSGALGAGEKLMASLDGGVTLIDITTMVNGTSFSWTGVTLKPGQGSIRWLVIDAMGNRGNAWDVSYTLDTTLPAAPTSAPDLLTADDVGGSNSDNVTTVSRPRIAVDPLPAGAVTVELLINGVAVPAQFDPATNTLTGNQELANAGYAVSYRYVDAAGNISATSDVLSLTIGPDPIIVPSGPVIATPLVITAAPKTAPLLFPLLYVRPLGDVNNDGFDDFAMSGTIGLGPLENSHTVIYGSASYTAQVMTVSQIPVNRRTLLTPPEDSPGRLTNGIAGAGDFNSDGIPDVMAATQGVTGSPARNNPPSVSLYFNNTPGVRSVEGQQVLSGPSLSWGREYFDGLGQRNSTASAGDLNGDGRDDLVLGASGVDPITAPGNYGGQVYAVYGTPSAVDINVSTGRIAAGAGFKISSSASNNQLGRNVSGVGDLNGDGFADFAMRNTTGGTFFVFGGATGANFNEGTMTTTQGFKLSGLSGMPDFVMVNGLQQWLEYKSTAYAGDFNGDGFADAAISDPTAGKLYIVTGRSSSSNLTATGFNASHGYVINGLASERFAHEVSYAGDINADGLGDLIVSAEEADGGKGNVYVIFGRGGPEEIQLSDIRAGQGGFVMSNSATGVTALGFNVSNAGDVNGDGLEDLIVGTKTINQNHDPYLILNHQAFSGSRVTQMGTALADRLTDNSISGSLIGGLGNDELTANAASVLYGGSGNDTFVIGDSMATALKSLFGNGGNNDRLARIDGGAGRDTIRLASGVDLDLTLVANQSAGLLGGGSRIDDVEIIDLGAQGQNLFKLTLLDVIDMSSSNVFEATGRKQLMVNGGVGDTVQLMDTNAVGVWTKAANTVTLDGAQYHVLNHNTAAATLYVQDGVAVTDFVAGAPGVQVIDPAWVVNSSRLTIDYTSSPKTGWIDADDYVNNSWDDSDSYRTDNDDVFAYDFSRIVWDGARSTPRWELKSWQIGQGDRIKDATVLNGFDGGQQIVVPSSFGSTAGGDDQIDDGQFEVYYGILANGVFTVTSTNEFANSQTNKGGATHTLILFDNDSQSRSGNNTLNDLLGQGNHANYVPEQGYRETYSGSEIYLSHPFWLDAAVVAGVYEERGWSLTKDANGTNQKLGWEAPTDYISIGRLDVGKSAFGAWFDTDQDGVRDTGETPINITDADRGDFDYYYKLEGVDFASGDYTVRFVDPVLVRVKGAQPQDMELFTSATALAPWDKWADLGLDKQGFGAGDRVIIDKVTNASDWSGLAVAPTTDAMTLNGHVMVDLGVTITANNLTFIV
jgi:hypothetical protein